jgi:predicted nuclease of predicted toxin-antitoxin system
VKFLANENFPAPSIRLLRDSHLDVLAIAEIYPGITDEEAMNISIKEGRTIITHDSDYGELIFKYGYKPNAGVIYFRVYHFEPEEPAKLLLELLRTDTSFTQMLTVIGEDTIRQRAY